MSKDPVSRKTVGLGYALYKTRPLQEHPSSQIKRKLGGERKGWENLLALKNAR